MNKTTTALSTELKLKRFIVNIAQYGNKIFLAASLAHLLRDLDWLRSQGLTLTIVCEDKRKDS